MSLTVRDVKQALDRRYPPGQNLTRTVGRVVNVNTDTSTVDITLRTSSVVIPNVPYLKTGWAPASFDLVTVEILDRTVTVVGPYATTPAPDPAP
jgi:hypothetical protein